MTYDELLKDCINVKNSGRIIYVIGNGGSATQAEHLAGELLPNGVPCVPLTNIAVVTSIGNDDSFDKVFSIPVLTLGREGDVLLCLTTSNKSKNIRSAQYAGLVRGMKVYTITSRNAPDMNNSKLIRVASNETPNVQEETLQLLHDLWKDLTE